MNFSIAQRHVRVLVIDATRNHGEGWQWNSWFTHGSVLEGVCDLKPRAMLRELRRKGLLNRHSVGKVAVEDDGYNMVIKLRGTGEPIIALEYGCLVDKPLPDRRKPLIVSEILCRNTTGGFYGTIAALFEPDAWEIYKEAAEAVHQKTGDGEAKCCAALDSAWGAEFARSYLMQSSVLSYQEALEAAYDCTPPQI